LRFSLCEFDVRVGKTNDSRAKPVDLVGLKVCQPLYVTNRNGEHTKARLELA
jgi:hypothetical protein